MYGSVTAKIVLLISSAKTTAEEWNTLTRFYANKSHSRVMQLKEDLSTMTLNSRSVSEFLRAMKVRSDELGYLMMISPFMCLMV